MTSMLESADIFVTGGAGTLGKAIARRRAEKGWTGRLTVYSTDAGKHNALKALYPDVITVQGDIRSPETLRLAMLGHDIVIHAAAVKFIPDSEWASIDTVDVNVYGSQIVCEAALETGVKQVLGISTDKACHPANTYGASKMMMEKIFQEYARADTGTVFNLVRYGNVLESRGSVIEAWKKAVEAGQPIKVTDEKMTRFWLSPSQAVDYVVESLDCRSGWIYVPKMPALSIGRLLEYTIGREDCTIEQVPLRPGEKKHETLLTVDEADFAELYEDAFVLHPSTSKRLDREVPRPYTSDTARELTEEELETLLKDE